MKRAKKNLFCVLLIFTLLFSTGAVAFAGDSGSTADPNASKSGEYFPMTIIYSTVGIERQSATRAYVEVIGFSGLPVDKLSATITLQEKAFGTSTWKDTSTSVYVEENSSVVSYKGYMNVTNTKNYRLKVVFREHYNGTIYSTTDYSNII